MHFYLAAMSSQSVFVRRAEFEDRHRIQSLVKDEAHTMAKRYGDFELTTMIETASLGITAVNEKDELIGYAALFDYPYTRDEIDGASWPGWLDLYFQNKELTAANAAWLTFFIADPLCQAEVAENILRTAFTTLPEIDSLLLALPTDVRPFAPLKDTFERLPALDGEAPPYNVYLCPRALYLPELLVREARVEDHDDLVPVFNAQSEVLTERYGDFFIAELIASQDEMNKALVAEVEGHAIGLMSCSTEIDISILQECFDLSPYDGLMKPDENALHAAHVTRDRATAADKAAAIAEKAAAAAAAEAAAAAQRPAQAEESAEGESAAANGVGDEGGAMEEADTAAAADSAAAAALKVRTEANALSAAAIAAEEGVTYLCSAFCVSVFCVDEAFESRSCDFLSACFALFPEKEYVIVTLPHTAAEFPLLNYFNQVEPQPTSSFGHILYLFHRDALLGTMKVRPAIAADDDAVRVLTKGLTRRAQMDAAFFKATAPLPKSEEQEDADADEGAEPAPEAPRGVVAFTGVVSGQIVGLALIKRVVDIEKLQSQYSLEDFLLMSEHREDQHIELLGFVINPIFARSSRFLLKEVLRQMGATCVYYNLEQSAPMPDVLSEFVQVQPRAQLQIPASLSAELACDHPDESPIAPAADRALFFLTRKLISEPKIVNNTRILVVGASDTALAFLESLISVPYINFTSLYLLAPHAAKKLLHPRGELQLDDSVASATFFSRTCSYSANELASLNLGARVRLIDGMLVDIDRTRKAVSLPDESIVPYDYLIFAPELGDQSLRNLSADAALYRGVFSLCDEEAAATACEFLKTAAGSNSSMPVVVYGGSVDAYCTIEALITRGVPANELLLMTPPPSASGPSDPFGDPRIAQKVHKRMASLGVTLHHGVTLTSLEADDSQLITAALFTDADGSTVPVPARMLLCAGAHEIDRTLFRALNDNSLVYDGGLVVDASFRTNDPAVFAAGPVTKFARRFRSKLPMHMCSGREAGAKMAQLLLPAIDPLSESQGEQQTLPTFSRPTKLGATLPGGLHFLRVLQPTIGADEYGDLIKHRTFGRELVNDLTTDAEQWKFASLRLDRVGRVSSLVYLGKEPIEVHNWSSIIGLHEAALNHLASRFDEGIVTDLPAFLRENWAMALYHDRFTEFRTALRQEMEDDDDIRQVLVQMRELSKQGEPVSAADFVTLLPESKQSLVRSRLLDHLQAHKNQLRMYLVPSSGIMKKMENKRLH